MIDFLLVPQQRTCVDRAAPTASGASLTGFPITGTATISTDVPSMTILLVHNGDHRSPIRDVNWFTRQPRKFKHTVVDGKRHETAVGGSCSAGWRKIALGSSGGAGGSGCRSSWRGPPELFHQAPK
jgi:hypothetical protein